MISKNRGLPLCVDLDGTLVLVDTLVVLVKDLLRHHPHLALVLPFWLLGGRCGFKKKLMARVSIDPVQLPYHDKFLNFLKGEREKGRQLFLVTGAHESVAVAVARYLGIFDGAYGTTDEINLTGSQKAKLLMQLFSAKGGFAYAGNSSVDLKVWSKAREAIVVNASKSVVERAQMIADVSHVF